MSEAFVTGSRAYGAPTAESDIDLVVRVNSDAAALLRKLNENKDPKSQAIRFGKLNLILCEDDAHFAVWKLGTEEAKKTGGVVQKSAAKTILDKFRDIIGFKDTGSLSQEL